MLVVKLNLSVLRFAPTFSLSSSHFFFNMLFLAPGVLVSLFNHKLEVLDGLGHDLSLFVALFLQTFEVEHFLSTGVQLLGLPVLSPRPIEPFRHFPIATKHPRVQLHKGRLRRDQVVRAHLRQSRCALRQFR